MLDQWNVEVKASRNLGITKDRATNNCGILDHWEQ